MDVEGASTSLGNGAQSVESHSRPVRRHLDDGKFEMQNDSVIPMSMFSVIVKLYEEFGLSELV